MYKNELFCIILPQNGVSFRNNVYLCAVILKWIIVW